MELSKKRKAENGILLVSDDGQQLSENSTVLSNVSEHSPAPLSKKPMLTIDKPDEHQVLSGDVTDVLSYDRKAEDNTRIDHLETKKTTSESDGVSNSFGVNNSSGSLSEPASSGPTVGGFAAYAKVNPFIAAAAKGFGFPAPNSSLQLSGFGSNSQSSRPNFTMPPPLVVPSPKSPRANPFSSPSPKHNPFMTIVESKDELWQSMAKDKLSDEDIVKSTIFGSRRPSKSGGDSFPLQSTDKEKEESKVNEAKEMEEPDDDGEGDEEDENEEDATNELPPMKTYALPQNVTIVTGEEDEECIFQVRAKLYRLSVPSSDGKSSSPSKPLVGEEVSKGADDDGTRSETPSAAPVDKNTLEWIEVGVGPLKILKRKIVSEPLSNNSDSSKSSQGRLVMRREDKIGGGGTKLLLNIRLDRYASVVKQGEKTMRVVGVNFVTAENSKQVNQLGTFLIKTKEGEECNKLLVNARVFLAN